MNSYWSDIINGGKSLVVGLGITAREFFKPVVTEQYPWETPTMLPRYRGHIELIGNAETGAPNCVVCGMCQRACPSNCISLDGQKAEGGKGKVLTRYILDFTKCSLCGLCVENCKFNALRFSNEYNLAGFDKNDFVMDLMKRLEDQNRCKH